MKIGTESYILFTIFILILTAFATGAYLNSLEKQQATEANIVATRMIQGIFELNILTNDYLLNKQERVIKQWQLQYNAMGEAISPQTHAEHRHSEREFAILQEMRKDYKDLGETFVQLTQQEIPQELEARLISRLLIESQFLVSDSFELSNLATYRIVEARTRDNYFILVSLISMFIISLIVMYIMFLTILIPLRKFSKGTEIIGKGNLDYKIDIQSKNEIGGLAQAFNKMTEDLQKTTVSRDYVDNVVNSMIDMLVVVSPEAKIRTINPVTTALLGYSEDELIGKDVSLIFPEPEQEQEERFFKDKRLRKLIKEGSAHNIEMTYLTKSGEKIPVSLSSSVMRHREREGELIGVVILARDMRQTLKLISDLEESKRELTELSGTLEEKVKERTKDLTQAQEASLNILEDLTQTKEELELQTWGLTKANEGIKVLYKELRKALEVKSVFTSHVSHELRTPLAAIKEGVGIVLDGVSGSINADQKKFLTVAKNNIDRLARLINDVLDFQKLEAGKMAFKIEENDINTVAKEVRESMLSLAEKKDLDFILQMDENLPKVRFDRDKITQVLTNLVNNAIKFTEKGGITIATSHGDNFIQVSVKDTGLGIKKEDIPRLFAAFEQLDTGMARKGPGTGLGLAISKEIIEAHKGKIWVGSEFGKGSTFYFTFPKEIKERKKIGEILVEEGLISKDALREALKKQEEREE